MKGEIFFKTPGSIPACAGEPLPTSPRIRTRKVYPRVCGGTAERMRTYWNVAGLSPRVRGNRLAPAVLSHLRGSIPACAGEPRQFSGTTGELEVYPRVCGGTKA